MKKRNRREYYQKVKSVSISRKINIGAWKSPGNPVINCKLDIEVSSAQAYLRKLREQTGEKITINHFVAKVVGHCLKSFPEFNCILMRNILYQRNDISLSFMVNISRENTFELANFLIPDIDKKSLLEVTRFIQEKSNLLKENFNKESNSMGKMINKIPTYIFPILLKILDFFQYTLNFNLSRETLPPHQSGSAIVTAVGSLGIEEIYGSLSHLAHCPLTVAVGRIRKMPIVVNDKIEIGNVATITLTYDHRYADAVHYAKMQALFKDMFEHPEKYTEVFIPV